jgi:hypothetical protein
MNHINHISTRAICTSSGGFISPDSKQVLTRYKIVTSDPRIPTSGCIETGHQQGKNISDFSKKLEKYFFQKSGHLNKIRISGISGRH